MLRPKACQLNLLGVQKAFDLDLQDTHALQAFQPTTLFPTCVLTIEDLQLCEPHEAMPLSIKAWRDPQTEAMELKRSSERGAQSLNLLLCNTFVPSSPALQANAPIAPISSIPSFAEGWRTCLREELNMPFEVIYGQGPQLIERIRFAWCAALKKWGLSVQEQHVRPLGALRFHAFCEKCSDPQCERHLFGLNRVNGQ
jgi:hypothetical protein